MSDRVRITPGWALASIGLAVVVLGPLIFSDFFVSQILTRAIWLGIAAMSLSFLAGYGGMISLAQTALYGIAGFTMGNLVQSEGGTDLTLNPWVGAILGILVATLAGLVMGAVASRAEGIYFLMLTLAFGILTYYFFVQVSEVAGFGGLNRVDAPDLVSNPVTDPANLFYIALIVAALLYAFARYLTRTPFGISLQGIRDEPTRMRALGYDVMLHRTLAFAAGAFIASLAGVLAVWWNTQISPQSIDIFGAIDILIIAVIGGLHRLEGAFLGALVFALLDNYTRSWELIGERFNTVIAGIFLAIVLLSPGGLIGLWESASRWLSRRPSGRPAEAQGGETAA
jgi:branched-chain amino acid transport system permease protein